MVTFVIGSDQKIVGHDNSVFNSHNFHHRGVENNRPERGEGGDYGECDYKKVSFWNWRKTLKDKQRISLVFVNFISVLLTCCLDLSGL